MPSFGASRSLISPQVAKPMASSASLKLLVMRAYDCTKSGSRSVNIRRGQVDVPQANLRTARDKLTRRPPQGRSASILT
jgi:hypothetical protein